MSDIREEVKELQIGLKIRRLRQQRRMTLQDLADATGLSKPLISQIENDQVIPPLATLLRIAKSFRIDLNFFFQQEGSNTKCVCVRAGESFKSLKRSHPESPPPYSYHSLSHGKQKQSIEPFIIEFDATVWDDDLLVSHEGEEFMYLLEGEVEFHYGDQVLHLKAGDSVSYDSDEPHGYVAISEQRPRAIAVVYTRNQ